MNKYVVLADWIAQWYPATMYPRVLDVAGGRGQLALELIARGYQASTVDPKNKTRPERFRAEMAAEADLVVGLHPDGATQQICEAVAYCPVVVVPCCNYWPGHHGHVAHACRDFFRDVGASTCEHELPIKGRKTLIQASV